MVRRPEVSSVCGVLLPVLAAVSAAKPPRRSWRIFMGSLTPPKSGSAASGTGGRHAEQARGRTAHRQARATIAWPKRCSDLAVYAARAARGRLPPTLPPGTALSPRSAMPGIDAVHGRWRSAIAEMLVLGIDDYLAASTSLSTSSEAWSLSSGSARAAGCRWSMLDASRRSAQARHGRCAHRDRRTAIRIVGACRGNAADHVPEPGEPCSMAA